MLNQFLVFISLIGIFLASVFTDQDITVKLETPAEVQAGEEFEVNLVIEKGSIQSFSRFTQELPYGLVAKRVSTANADFSFENQRLRLIWLKLPADEKITVSYSVSVHERLKGEFDLGGEFAFVMENERKTIDVIGGGKIKIIPDPEISDSLLVDINDAEKVFKPGPDSEMGMDRLMVTRTSPEQTGNYQYTISLNIKKGNLQKFAKIEEYVPDGYRAVEGDSKDGIFSFSQGVIKILWMNLPDEPEFEVSYRIIPNPGKSVQDMNLNGNFSYITGNATETISILNLKDVIARQELAESQEIEREVPEQTKELSDQQIDSTIIAVAESDARTKNQIIVKEEKTPVEVNRGNNQMLQAEDGIYYRVQLAAGHQKVDIEKYFHKRNVKDDVRLEFHEGWRKYTTGSFRVYKEARDYRVMIWDTTPIDDAFVSAYDNGRRITVQEALMVTNHKWYR